MLKGVIFDIDGTLVDSNDAHASAWVETFAEGGYQVAFDVVRRMIGMGGDKLMPACIGIEEDSKEGKKLSERRGELFKDDYLPKLKSLPGSRALLQRIREDGLKTVVATSASDEDLKGLLKAAEVLDLMQDAATSSDAENSKPDPDIVVAAIRKIGLARASLVMIGDTPYDIEAAQQAGVRIIGFRSGGWTDSELSGATAVYDGPADLENRYESSILARRQD